MKTEASPTRKVLTIENVRETFPWLKQKAMDLISESIYNGGTVVAFPSPGKNDLVWLSDNPATAANPDYIIDDFKSLQMNILKTPGLEVFLKRLPMDRARRVLFNMAMTAVLIEFEARFRKDCAMPLIGHRRHKLVKERMLHTKSIIDLCNAQMGVMGLIDTNIALLHCDRGGVLSTVYTQLWKVKKFGEFYIPEIYD